MSLYCENSYDSFGSLSRLDLVPSRNLKETNSSNIQTHQGQRVGQNSKETKAGNIILCASDEIVAALSPDLSNYFVDGDRTLGDEGKHKLATVSSLSRCIKWTRCHHTSAEDEMEMEPFVLGVIEASQFLEELLKSSDDIEFEALQSLANSFGFEPGVSKTLGIIELDKAIVQFQRRLSTSGPGNCRNIAELVDSATAFLMYAMDVEVIVKKTKSEFCEYLHSVTRLIAEHKPAEELFITELDGVTKASKEKAPEGLSEKEKELFEMRQTWSAMLQMIPLMSKEKALALINHRLSVEEVEGRDEDKSGAPGPGACPQTLFDYFNHNPDPAVRSLPVAQKSALLQNQFGKDKNGAVKNHAKLSKHVYSLMTAQDPNGSL